MSAENPNIEIRAYSADLPSPAVAGFAKAGAGASAAKAGNPTQTAIYKTTISKLCDFMFRD
jgi:hypothetical protein